MIGDILNLQSVLALFRYVLGGALLLIFVLTIIALFIGAVHGQLLKDFENEDLEGVTDERGGD